ncbi:hypothetical protein Goarm_013564 [Gossypium armourianum]|uniref:Uncharacterized protein n=1 Tax=Gossypium armourianum TaxID=34283 RepID=A0A7J9J3K2_9ROSI|nr:hypothetical protein [Gossypium armourianum]
MKFVLHCGLYGLPEIIWCMSEQTRVWVRLLALFVAIV